MTDKFHEMQAEISTAACDAVNAPPLTIYLVAAWDCIAGNWKIHRESNLHEYLTAEAAEAAASKLNKRWRHRRIITAKLA